MQIYLVGGAVRDQLLGLPVQERDWVVVGSTVEDMLAKGFLPVGKDFPVFLHPDTKEEYALARTERKTNKGYHGFVFHTDPSVTLEEDLKRRDLTINAMAQDENGKLIDPYNGQQDLQDRCFRHVSTAFAEDPVRILRLARFSARLPEFHTHPDTVELMRSMVNAGEVDALVAERVWKECERALADNQPCRFFQQLRDAHALDRLFSSLPDFDTAEKSLNKACQLSDNPTIRWAAWSAEYNKADYTALNQQYRIPNQFKELTLRSIEHSAHYLQLATHTDAADLLSLIISCGGLRDQQKWTDFQTVCSAITDTDISGWNGKTSAIATALRQIDTQDLQAAGLKGADFAAALKNKQLALIATEISA